MLRSRTLLSVSLSVILGAWAWGCSDESGSDGPGDGGATSSGGTTASGGTSSGSGGASSGGDGNGSGGEGTGGEAPSQNVLPGAENYDCSAASGTAGALRLEPIARDFTRPVLVTHAPGDTERLFVLEQEGVISVVKKTSSGEFETLGTPFLDISARVTRADNELGLLGLAFHPNYEENGLFYVHYSASNEVEDAGQGDTIIEEYRVSSDADVADAASRRLVLWVDQPSATNHNGGTIAFGPGEYLFIALGDGGSNSGTAQNVSDLLGDILRIDPLQDGDSAYSTPSDNLRQDNAEALPEIWSMGLRNPYRMNFDGCTGDLYIGDVGQSAWEEINLVPRGEGRKNFGWPDMEGLACQGGRDCSAYEPPVAVVSTSSSSVVGGAVYRGVELPALRGTYFFGRTNGGAVFTLRYENGEVSEPVDVTNDVNPSGDGGREVITSIQNGGDGEIYFTSFSGRVLKLVAE